MPDTTMEFKYILTKYQFAEALNVPLGKITYLIYKYDKSKLYYEFTIPKKSGGERTIKAPCDDLKEIQKKLADILWETHSDYCKNHNIKLNFSHAFEKEKSIITNAVKHKKKKYIVNIDLKDFFEQFHFGRVKGFFEKNREFYCSEDVAFLIAKIACFEGTLPQGAPTSPIIANLIANNLDIKMIKIMKKYRLDYTRYADDITFSTNDKKFMDNYTFFYNDVKNTIEECGFSINEKKTRLTYQDSRQEVTGLTVNKKVNVNRTYYNNTRAMADSLYKTGKFTIDGKEGTLNMLEGRFAFINQIDKYNNTHGFNSKNSIYTLNMHEKQYQTFIFYKNFWANAKPLIITEGKTDVLYIKAALMKFHDEYPDLIRYKYDDISKKGTFEYKISFLKRTNKIIYFILGSKDGADAMKNIYNLYVGKNQFPNIKEYLYQKSKTSPQNPVILIFDNENKSSKKKPLREFLNNANVKGFKSGYNLVENLSVVTNPLVGNKNECEIEDLFDDKTLGTVIGNKTFNRDPKADNNKYYGKAKFAEYVYKNYKDINFDEFKPMLKDINDIVNKKNTNNKIVDDKVL